MGNSSNKGFSTRAIHAGGHPDKETGAVMPPIYQTSTYVQSSPGEHKGYEYTRSHNPTRSRLEENLASLEQTRYALTSASGLSMIDLIMHMLPAGSKIIMDDVYGGTYRLFTTVFQDRHDFTFIDTTDLRAVKQALQKELIYLAWESYQPNAKNQWYCCYCLSRKRNQYAQCSRQHFYVAPFSKSCGVGGWYCLSFAHEVYQWTQRRRWWSDHD